MSATPRTPIDVAVGVLIDGEGRFLMTSRPTGKVYADHWEFPGGKLEPGDMIMLDVEDAATWLAKLATATAGGMPKKTRIGVIRKPPPMPNRPEINPTPAPKATRSGPLTETSAIGR